MTAGALIVIAIGLLALVLTVRWALLIARPWCRHEHVRCIHGDEILARHNRRVACLDCGRSLDWPLPTVCSWTGRPHDV